jgi:hypothetical protein
VTLLAFDLTDVIATAEREAALQRQLRRALEQRTRMWALGFEAAADLYEQGGTLDQLRALVAEKT